MNRLAVFALLAGSAMLSACGAGSNMIAPVSNGPGPSGNSSQAAPVSAFDTAGQPLSSVNFASADPGTLRTFTVMQPNFGGAFTERDTCAKIATVTTISNANGAGVFRVTPVGGGTCTITITGNAGAQLTIPVGVTSTPISVS